MPGLRLLGLRVLMLRELPAWASLRPRQVVPSGPRETQALRTQSRPGSEPAVVECGEELETGVTLG